MSFFLIADAEPAKGLMPLLRENWLVLLPPLLGFIAIYLLLPKARQLKPIWGGIIVAGLRRL